MKKPDYETATLDELRIYAQYQDKILEGAGDLQKMLAYTCSVIAEDLENVLAGNVDEMKFLSNNKDDKIFERFTVLVKLRTELSSLSLLPEEVETAVKAKVAKLKLGDNAFEELMKQAKEKNGSTKI